VPVDSVQLWLEKKEKHVVSINNRIPVFIRYFTCAGQNGKIVFFEDIYNEDQELADKLFAGKNIKI
jgi:murein L,D-transpeptidase YcbB/YkuD